MRSFFQQNQLRSQVANASETEFDFLTRCLRYQPGLRISAQEALFHTYLSQNVPIELEQGLTCNLIESPKKAIAGSGYSDDDLDLQEREQLYFHSGQLNARVVVTLTLIDTRLKLLSDILCYQIW